MNHAFPIKLSVAAAALAAAFATGGALAQGASAPAIGTAAPKSEAPKSDVAKADREFARKAALGGLAEVQLGELAQQKASNDGVRQFGARMVQDHGKANDELKQIAGAKGLSLPTEPDREHKKHHEKLSKLSGAAFDGSYVKHMVDDHKKTVALFEKQAKSGKDAELKGFAEKTLPTLQDHLKQAESLRSAHAKH